MSARRVVRLSVFAIPWRSCRITTATVVLKAVLGMRRFGEIIMLGMSAVWLFQSYQHQHYHLFNTSRATHICILHIEICELNAASIGLCLPLQAGHAIPLLQCLANTLLVENRFGDENWRDHNSKVSDQNGISRLYIIQEMYHSGRKPIMLGISAVWLFQRYHHQHYHLFNTS